MKIRSIREALSLDSTADPATPTPEPANPEDPTNLKEPALEPLITNTPIPT
jgi:hypothetical protein